MLVWDIERSDRPRSGGQYLSKRLTFGTSGEVRVQEWRPLAEAKGAKRRKKADGGV